MRSFLDKMNTMLDAPVIKGGGLVLLLIVYFSAYLNARDLPCESFTRGWWGHWDQAWFLKSALALAKGSVTPETYWYPLGYPALGALFTGVLPAHPFLPVNAACLALSAVFFWKIARRFLSPLMSMAVIVLCWAWLRGEAEMSLLKPWNTIPAMALSYWLVLEQFRSGTGRARAVGQFTLVGAVYLIRPSDALFLLPLPLMAAFRGRPFREGFLTAAAGSAVFALFPLAEVLINLDVFGAVRTPYEANTAAIGFFSQPLGVKLYSLFVDALPVFGLPNTSLIPRMPWLLLAPAGLMAGWREEAPGVVAFTASAVLCLAVYVGYNDFTPLNLYTYELIHYLFWMLPLLMLFAVLGVARLAVLKPAGAAVLMVAAAVLVMTRLEASQLFSGVIDASGRVSIPGGTGSTADAMEVDAMAPMPPFGPAMREDSGVLLPFRNYLLWNTPAGANVYFTKSLDPQRLTVVPESLRNRQAVFTSYRWSLRDVSGFREMGLRLLGGSGLFSKPPLAVVRPGEHGVSVVEVRLEGPESLLRGASSWFIFLEGAGGYCSAEPNLPLTLPLRVEGTPQGGGLTFLFETDRSLAPGAKLRVSPLDKRGRPLLSWEGAVSFQGR